MAVSVAMATVPELIAKKRDGEEFNGDEIQFVVDSICNGTMQDSQIGAMLMAIRIRGMSTAETVQLTKTMLKSGHVFTWPEQWRHLVADKHSTGGVGDKISLVLGPALAACGLKVPMISGRGLIHTGGTLDKLESIPGFNVTQSIDNFMHILDTVGCCIAGQTASMVPADRILYALRDVTSTVDCLPLITSSILSKKAAEGLSSLVLDVKLGRGAVIADQAYMKQLARDMCSVSNGLGIKTTAVLTDMDSPIGNMIGNALEVAECIDCLHGNGPTGVTELVAELGGHLLHNSHLSSSHANGRSRILQTLQDGSAMNKFRQMLVAQDVSASTADALCARGADVFGVLPKAALTTDVMALETGYVTDIEPLTCALVSNSLGAGRTIAGQKLDLAVGLQIRRHLGSRVSKGDVIMTVHHSSALPSDVVPRLQSTYSIGDVSPTKNDAARVIEVLH